MKQTIIVGLLAMASAASAQQNDTVVINNPKQVTIVTGDSLQRVIVKGKAGDDSFTYQSTLQLVDSNYVSTVSIGRERWELIPSVKVGRKKENALAGDMLTAHFGIGFTAPTKCDDNVEVSTFRSWELFATILQWDHFLDKRARNYVSLGLGIDWRNYRMTGDRFFTKAPDGNVTTERYPLEVEPKFSRIHVFALTATLRYEHVFGDGYSIGFGPVLNYNTHASIKTKYKLQGEKTTRMENNIRQRPLTIDWMLNVDIDGIPFYVKYSPNDVLKDGGVKFRSLSFGLYL